MFDFYKKAGISEEELEIYAEMERNFQKYIWNKMLVFYFIHRNKNLSKKNETGIVYSKYFT